MSINYELGQDSSVTIKAYDPDGGLIRELVSAATRAAGPNSSTWDGRDFMGKLVPDESYTFTIETAAGAVYDPTTLSGGIVGDITKAQFDHDAGTIVYSLPGPSRVLIRLGVHNGPMLMTLVDWKPRVAGSITEYWDGHDKDKLINLRDSKDFNALITYITLPQATVITYGNTNETYREYKLGRGKDRALRPQRESKANPQVRKPPIGLVPPAWARSPVVSMIFPKQTNDVIPELQGMVDVRVDVAEADKDELLKGQFEVMFFVDNVFFAEAERGYVPYNWKWELNQLPPGEHFLTVNVSTVKGQVGTASRKVKVVTPKK